MNREMRPDAKMKQKKSKKNTNNNEKSMCDGVYSRIFMCKCVGEMEKEKKK